MALLTTGNFYTATFHPPTHASWSAASPVFPGNVSGELAAAVYKAAPDPIAVYVIDSTSGTFAFPGGQAYNFADAMLNGAATAGTTFALDALDTSVTTWCLAADGTVFAYDAGAGILREYSGAEATAFKAFLP